MQQLMRRRQDSVKYYMPEWAAADRIQITGIQLAHLRLLEEEQQPAQRETTLPFHPTRFRISAKLWQGCTQ